MYQGTICAPESARAEITQLGVTVGPYDAANAEFTDCEASDEAVDRLSPFWGVWIWSLLPVESEPAL